MAVSNGRHFHFAGPTMKATAEVIEAVAAWNAAKALSAWESGKLTEYVRLIRQADRLRGNQHRHYRPASLADLAEKYRR
ncbi:hypothetical protein ACVW1C_001876 [Bradyrhizobium sp. USDA 4011]